MTKKILFVDDAPSMLDGHRRALHDSFRPDAAVGGHQALELVANAGPYAVIVSDMHMPSTDGVEFFSRVARSSPNTILVMLTGYADLTRAFMNHF